VSRKARQSGLFGVWERSWAFALVAPDLVHGSLAEPDNVERVKADLGVRDAGGDRLLIAAGHVDRHRLDRVLAVTERVKEGVLVWRRCGPGRTTRSRPRDVHDRGQVPLAAAV